MRAALHRAALGVVDFVVGDDWTLVLVVVGGLALTWSLAAGDAAWAVLPALVLAALGLSVARAARAARPRGRPPGQRR